MIYYFSATGNSKVAAERLAEKTGEECLSISELLKEGKYCYSAHENERIGFVFPTYFYGVPTVVIDFIEKLELQNIQGSYFYLVLTCGGSTGEAGNAFERMLAQKGYVLSAQYSVKMPDNYVPIFKIPAPEKLEELNRQADQQIEDVCEQVVRRTAGDRNKLKGFASAPMTKFLYPLYEKGRKTKKFYVTEVCSHCGLCQAVCPCQAIQMAEGKPHWTKERCSLCLGCLHRCPVAAIQYGKSTEKKGRYLHPKAHL
ncbi:EFR1 family ferrodoxin [Clostridium aminobutyricum]|uniref:EFR1 family ferrodoxin n=1 Tax=Clostridium aminobutyricum TaxID=33953 RepID=A0A939IGG3_CLOAM|nr:EFR1 family ferrodoxin [Clostridium aminobutyricum]MBN7771867.1 EFR1 family ferrodoxin [Clostridium aminobutyricum]